jgi:peptidoglycan hydrolase-like protein with peptidoglycan-binding domain
MRRLILTTASVIALGAGPANAWSHHAAMHSRAEVRDVQQKLQADNLYHGNIDGLLGSQTRRAIAEYQKQNGLRVTANLDRQTRDSLLGTTGMGTGTPPAPATHMTPAPSQGGTNTPPPGQAGANMHPAPSGGTPPSGR